MPNEALGLPKGSVRAMIILMVTVTVCFISVYSVIEKLLGPKEILIVLVGLLGTLIGTYIGMKKAKSEENNGTNK